MPAKKAARPKRTVVKAAPRKAPTPRKAAKPAARKPRPTAVRVKPAKPVKAAKPAKAKPHAVVALTRPAKSDSQSPPVRDTAIMKPRPPAPAQVAEARSTFPSLAGRPAARRIGPSDDDEDGSGSHNLLLGPRNVRPYRERKGEAYMGRDQLDHFRGILSSWKRDLMEEVDRTMLHMKDEAANPPDPNDRATLESEFALELRTRDRERKLIRKIDEALSRIEDGSYGYCVETGEPIGVKRLEARPVATLCIEAQERRERREKQYGDRDDWYR
jgi:DnaK suppressor protein